MEARSRYQNEVAKWNETILGGTSIDGQTFKFYEEVQEARTEINALKPNVEAIAEELTDVIIVSLGMIHAAGMDFEEMFYRKLNRNYDKYMNVPQYIEEGMSRRDALQKAKDEWPTTQKMTPGIDYTLMQQ